MIHSKQVVPFHPMEWFLMLDDFELIPKVSPICKRVHDLERRLHETKATFDIVWKSTPQISLKAHQTYQILPNGDIEIVAVISGMPFESAIGKWLLRAVPGSPNSTEVTFTFKWSFQKWVYGLVGAPVIHSILRNIVPSIQKQMEKEFQSNTQ